MLKSIRIRNFQRHEDIRIVFDPQITAIVGPSDVGKSSVLRAIRWNATNRPLGDGFIRDGSKGSVVKLWTDNGWVERRRGRENTYTTDSNVYEAFGSDVPGDVFKILKIDSINFQGQHEPPFWFDLSPGEVAKQLNNIVDLSLIDKTMSKLNTRLRTAKAELSVCQQRLEQSTEKYEKLEWVDDVDVLLVRVEKLERSKAKVITLIESMGKSISRATRSLQESDRLNELVMLGEAAIAIGASWDKLSESAECLSALIGDVEDYQYQLDQEVPDLEELDGLSSQVAGASDRISKLKALLRTQGSLSYSLKSATSGLSNAEKNLKDEVGDTCPLCGSPIGGD